MTMAMFWTPLLTSFLLVIPVTSMSSRPNIVLIVADDLGWNDVGFHGSEIKTPNLDRLAYEGVILNNYYVSPICTPTRGSLMTGRHPIHLGLQHYVISAPEPWGLPLNFTTMGQYLKTLGYSTHIVGKWHLGFFQESYLPTNRGFDTHYGYWTGKEDYYTHVDVDGYSGLDFRANMKVLNTTGYSTELYTNHTINLIYTHDKSRPLFLYLPYQAVHAGNRPDTIQAPDAYTNRFPYIANIKRRKFAGMVAALDDSVGAVVGALQDTGMMDNTVIVFTTDNGGPANNYDGNAACNFPLRGTKNTLWEGGVHGVGFVHSPLLKKTHYKSDNMIHVSDWLPTLYHVAGGNPVDLGLIDGINLWEMLSFNTSNVRTELLHNIDPKSHFSAIRVGDYKLIQGDISGGRNDDWYPCTPPSQLPDSEAGFDSHQTLLEEQNEYDYIAQYAYSVKHNRNRSDAPYTPYNIDCGPRPQNYTTNCKPEKKPCLFHIPSDPCEYNNIAEGNEDKVKDILQRLEILASSAVEPVNRPPDERADPSLHGGVWVPWLG